MYLVNLAFFIIAIVGWSLSNAPWYVNVYLVAINLVSLFAFVIDKRRAERGKWRIPELRLHLLTLAGGALGTGVGMIFAWHKVRKLSFRLMYLIGTIVIGLITGMFSRPAPTSAAEAKPEAVTQKASPKKKHRTPHATKPPQASSAAAR